MGRPYAYIKFDKTIKKKGKEFANPGSKSNTNRLNEDLADIQSIMKKNINEVLRRGDNIEHMQVSQFVRQKLIVWYHSTDGL